MDPEAWWKDQFTRFLKLNVNPRACSIFTTLRQLSAMEMGNDVEATSTVKGAATAEATQPPDRQKTISVKDDVVFTSIFNN